jgi:hypothetical protein
MQAVDKSAPCCQAVPAASKLHHMCCYSTCVGQARLTSFEVCIPTLQLQSDVLALQVTCMAIWPQQMCWDLDAVIDSLFKIRFDSPNPAATQRKLSWNRQLLRRGKSLRPASPYCHGSCSCKKMASCMLGMLCCMLCHVRLTNTGQLRRTEGSLIFVPTVETST